MPNRFSVAGPNSKYKVAGAAPAGFWGGFWHGLIAPIVFFVGLVVSDVRIYETNNNGNWYDFGFLLAIGAWASHSETRHAINSN